MEQCRDTGNIEYEPRMEGRSLIMIVAPKIVIVTKRKRMNDHESENENSSAAPRSVSAHGKRKLVRRKAGKRHICDQQSAGSKAKLKRGPLQWMPAPPMPSIGFAIRRVTSIATSVDRQYRKEECPCHA